MVSRAEDILYILKRLPHFSVVIASLFALMVSTVWFTLFSPRGFSGGSSKGLVYKSSSFFLKMGLFNLLVSYVVAFSLYKVGFSIGAASGAHAVWGMHGVGLLLGVGFQSRYHGIGLVSILMILAYLFVILGTIGAVLCGLSFR